mgnify:CR=1 FL=1
MNRLSLIFIALLITSCGIFVSGYSDYTTAKEHYDNGDYDQSIHHSYKSLTANNENKKVIKLFEKAYPLAIDQHLAQIDELSLIENDSKWPKIARKYRDLNKLNGYLLNLKPVLIEQRDYDLDLEENDYSSQMAFSDTLAANYHYTLGVKLNKYPSRDNQKLAAINFRLSQGFIDRFKDSRDLYNVARENAIINLFFRPFDGNKKYSSYIRDQVASNQSQQSKEFLRIIKNSNSSNADHYFEATLIANYKPPEKISNENIEQEKEVVVGKESYVDSTGETKERKIKGTVKATVNHYKKTSKGSMLLNYRISNNIANSVLYSGSVKGKKDYFYEWASFEGDKRALNSKYSKLINRKEQFAPSEDDFYLEISRNIAKQLERKISNHYSD